MTLQLAFLHSLRRWWDFLNIQFVISEFPNAFLVLHLI